MTQRRPKLELTWIGKEHRPRLEPHILREDPSRSYHASHSVHKIALLDDLVGTLHLGECGNGLVSYLH